MNHDFIPMIEPTPQPHKVHCKVAVFTIAMILSYGAFIASAIIWYLYDFFYAVGTLIILYLILGIVRSKLRNASIPLEQQEYSYTDQAIAAWYVSKQLLCDFTEEEQSHSGS